MKITLAAIVGNEEPVIERFIQSFAPAVDSIYLIRATGNQKNDLTIEKATRTAIKCGVELIWGEYKNQADFPHVDSFGNARQMAWESAIKLFKPEFIMWADADDVLVDGAAEAIREAAEDGRHDVYLMPYHVKGDKQVVIRERMIKVSAGSKWRYPIHEQLSFPKDVSYRVIEKAIFLHKPLETKTSSHERNCRILKHELSTTARNLFYLAQEYFQNNKEAQFKQIAEAALKLPDLEDLERYELLIQLAQTQGTDSRKLAAEAFAIMPDRREALALLANYCIVDRDYKKALQLAQRVIDTPSPRFSYWSQNNEWYGWKGAELYRQCLRLTGDLENAEADFQVYADEDKPIFSIIHATLGRPEQALAIREMLSLIHI